MGHRRSGLRSTTGYSAGAPSAVRSGSCTATTTTPGAGPSLQAAPPPQDASFLGAAGVLPPASAPIPWRPGPPRHPACAPNRRGSLRRPAASPRAPCPPKLAGPALPLAGARPAHPLWFELNLPPSRRPPARLPWPQRPPRAIRGRSSSLRPPWPRRLLPKHRPPGWLDASSARRQVNFSSPISNSNLLLYFFSGDFARCLDARFRSKLTGCNFLIR
jgi:hypothetical protein